MGCDIHDYVEVKKKGKWVKVGNVFPYAYHYDDKPSDVLHCYDSKTKTFIDGFHKANGKRCNSSCYVQNQTLSDHPYGRRNYNMFAILADVRNGRGFAGCDTGDGFNPIVAPRGIPKDASASYLKIVKQWGGDGHSHSYLTLREIEAYDWNQKTKHRGWVDSTEFQIFEKDGHPNSWCGGVGGANVLHVSNDEMRRLIKGGIPTNHTYTQIEWGSSYKDSVGEPFFEKTLPALRALGKPDDVRMVFFFDN